MRFTCLLTSILFSNFVCGLEVDLQINKRDPELSYLCWTPVVARLALKEPSAADVDVQIQSNTDSIGQLTFSAYQGADYTKADDFSPQEAIDITLPKDGSWINFLVAGKFGHASHSLHDAEIIVRKINDVSESAEFATTVRIRKNAETLNPQEWNSLLRAFAQLHDLANSSANSEFAKYPITHEAAWSMAHGAPAFLPWHRAFLLALERELQSIDPAVSLPYWKFEEAAPSVFTRSTLGDQNDVNDSRVILTTSPIIGWDFSGVTLARMQRDRLFSAALDVGAESRLLLSDSYALLYGRIERNHHNRAHGIAGQLGSGFSPADPLFFLLHANVDRVWANWQKSKNVFDPNSEQAYVPQGRYEDNPNRSRDKGNWSEDTLWPWDGDSSSSRGRQSLSSLDWNGYPQPSSIDFPVVDGLQPAGAPAINDMIDYNATLGRSASLGFCYDDIPFK